jgi:hypothetical protein
VKAFIRIWLPVAVCVAGAIVMIAKPDQDGLQGGALIISAGLSIWLLNLLYRIGVSGDRARDEEDEARDYFQKHGHWPDESPPPPPHRSG